VARISLTTLAASLARIAQLVLDERNFQGRPGKGSPVFGQTVLAGWQGGGAFRPGASCSESHPLQNWHEASWCDAMQTTARSRIEKLLALHYQSLLRFANRLCGSPERAMKLTQRTLRLALDRSRSLPVPANVRAWLLSILFHEFLEARPASSCGDDAVQPFAPRFDSRAASRNAGMARPRFC